MRRQNPTNNSFRGDDQLLISTNSYGLGDQERYVFLLEKKFRQTRRAAIDLQISEVLRLKISLGPLRNVAVLAKALEQFS